MEISTTGNRTKHKLTTQNRRNEDVKQVKPCRCCWCCW